MGRPELLISKAILAATAFGLSMLADFTALPGALWMVFKDRPDALKR